MASDDFPINLRASLASLLLCACLAVVHTWPLSSSPGVLSRNDAPDTVLHEWILAWIAHQAPRDPLHLFDANIFYPEPHTLAYSDHLIVQGSMAAPLLWAGASPVVAYNVVLLAGFALTGWSVSLLMRRWTGSWLAGVLAGSLAAFNALTLTRLPQIQDQHLEFFPLALLALDQLLQTPRLRHAIALAIWYLLQALTAGYILVFSFLSLLAAAIARPRDWIARGRELVIPMLAATTLVVVLLLPFMVPYLEVHREVGLTRSLNEVALYSAHPTDYLATGGRWHFAAWSHRFFKADALFPGITAALLMLFAIASGIATKNPRARMALAFGAFACLCSFGPATPVYVWLYHAFPLMSGIRGPARFGQFFLIAVALLAGFGLSALRQHISRTRGERVAIAFSLAVIGLANLEALRAPLWYADYHGIPAIYDTLVTEKPGVVVCLPFAEDLCNVRLMLASTRFWKPLLNGYSGYAPPSYFHNVEVLRDFPDRTAIEYLRAQGVTHVVVDAAAVGTARLALIDQVPELSLLSADNRVRIYGLK